MPAGQTAEAGQGGEPVGGRPRVTLPGAWHFRWSLLSAPPGPESAGSFSTCPHPALIPPLPFFRLAPGLQPLPPSPSPSLRPPPSVPLPLRPPPSVPLLSLSRFLPTFTSIPPAPAVLRPPPRPRAPHLLPLVCLWPSASHLLASPITDARPPSPWARTSAPTAAGTSLCLRCPGHVAGAQQTPLEPGRTCVTSRQPSGRLSLCRWPPRGPLWPKGEGRGSWGAARTSTGASTWRCVPVAARTVPEGWCRHRRGPAFLAAAVAGLAESQQPHTGRRTCLESQLGPSRLPRLPGPRFPHL